MMKTASQQSQSTQDAPGESMLDGMEHQAPVPRPRLYSEPSGNALDSSTSPHVIDHRAETFSSSNNIGNREINRVQHSSDRSRSRDTGIASNFNPAETVRLTSQADGRNPTINQDPTAAGPSSNNDGDSQWNEFMHDTGATFDQSMAIAGGEGLDPFSGFDIPFWLGQDQYWGMVNDWH